MDEVAGVLFVRQPRHRWCEVVRPQYGPQPALVTVVTPLVWRREIYVENANMLSRAVHRCGKNTTHAVNSLDPNTVRNQRWSQLWKPYTTGVKTTNPSTKMQTCYPEQMWKNSHPRCEVFRPKDEKQNIFVKKFAPQVWRRLAQGRKLNQFQHIPLG